MNSPMPVSQELFSVDAINEARKLAEHSARPLVEVLEARSRQDSGNFLRLLGQAVNMPVLSMEALRALTPAFERLSYQQAAHYACLPMRDADGLLLLVIADPFEFQLGDWAIESIHEPFVFALAHRTDIKAYLSRHEESLRAMDDAVFTSDTAGEETGGGIEHLSLQSIATDTSPVIRLVNSTLYDALKTGASDIHLETIDAGLVIKYRIDGVLTKVGAMQGADLAEQAVSRIKVLAELDISERRIPQDGRFKVRIQGRDVDFRVSIMPSIFGEDAVLRVLDRKSLSEEANGLSLAMLGFDDYIIDGFRQLVREPYGMVLVTGPTGSGKTTSLYAAISEVNHGQDKIITIEDPVEYQLPGVLQIPVNEKKGLTFARGLRSILRHDPDKIMVGEIRDAETAQIAVQSALTGHLVFTTLHANNVFDVISRFLHMNVEPYSLVAALNGVMAQRLVRLVCPNCAEPYMPSADLLKESRLTPAQVAGFQFRHGRGCGQCRGSGYRGRKAVAELLPLDDELREMIIAREPLRRLKEAARARGMKSLREAALYAVSRGQTTLEEINRVTFVA